MLSSFVDFSGLWHFRMRCSPGPGSPWLFGSALGPLLPSPYPACSSCRCSWRRETGRQSQSLSHTWRKGTCSRQRSPPVTLCAEGQKDAKRVRYKPGGRQWNQFYSTAKHWNVVCHDTHNTNWIGSLFRTTLQVWWWRTRPNFTLPCELEGLRVTGANLRRAMSEMTQDTLSSSPPYLWEGNLDGCYRNESEEKPILKAINIEPKSAGK